MILSLCVRPISENRSVLTYNTNACLSNLFYLKSDYIIDRKGKNVDVIRPRRGNCIARNGLNRQV